jgi:hypothetical protein
MSYFKSHWFDFLVGFINIGLATYYFCTGNVDTGIIWLISACIWLGMSRVEYNDERIQLLEAKAEKYDALAEKVDALQELQETSDKRTDQRLKKLEGRR